MSTRSSACNQYRRATGREGFTLVELMVVLGVVSVLAAFSAPAIEEFIARSRIEGFCRTTASLVRRTRLEGIKRGRPTVLRIDTVTGVGTAFVDDNGNSVFDDGERLIGEATLPGGLSFAAPNPLPAVDGFPVAGDEGWVSFNSDGSVAVSGAFRIADPRGNFLEIRIAPTSTAKVKVRKWDDTRAVNVDSTHWYSSGEGGRNWQWN